MKRVVLYLISLVNVFYFVNSLFIHLKKDDEKCFYDDFYTDTVVMVRYKILNKDISYTSKDDKRLLITVLKEDSKEPLHKFESGKLNGKFSFTIEQNGHYKICVFSQDKDFYYKRKFIKLSLIFDTDQEEFDESAVSVTTKDFKAVDSDVRKLFQKTSDIVKMQEYQIKREDEFSENQFNNSNKLIFITISQVAIITVIGIWQIFALRKVFKQKIWSPF